MKKITDINITSKTLLPTPSALCEEIEKTESAARFVAESREAINKIIFGDDRRLLVVVGPCSIHDLQAGREYAQKLAKLAHELDDRMLLVMRVYFEKPRTTVGWKGLIMDPKLDGTSDIPEGLRIARRFLREVIELGVPTATELLDPITPQYIADLISWSAIGARTTESQTHRQMASGPVYATGLQKRHRRWASTLPSMRLKQPANHKLSSALTTKARPTHSRPTAIPIATLCYAAAQRARITAALPSRQAHAKLSKAGLTPAIMTDCSHANSEKDPSRQPEVFPRKLYAKV